MEQNKDVKVNWGTINVPSIATMLAVGAIIWNASGKLTEQEARLNSIETQRTAKALEVNATIRSIQDSISAIPNLIYRITVAEQGINDLNRRVDRVGESMNNNFEAIRQGMNDLSTKFEVMDEKIDQRLPEKRAELDVPPPELRP